MKAQYFLCQGTGFGQKDTSRRYDAKVLEELYINTDEVYKIQLKTSDVEEGTITSHSSGEYYNKLTLNINVSK